MTSIAKPKSWASDHAFDSDFPDLMRTAMQRQNADEKTIVSGQCVKRTKATHAP
jgi:hypothetical protein